MRNRTHLNRRKLLNSGVALTATGLSAAVASDQSRGNDSKAASARGAFIVPAENGVPEGGAEDAQPRLQHLIDASAGDTRPILLNGIYRLDRTLRLRSDLQILGTGTLRANHSGPMLVGSDRPTARMRIEGLRLEAQAPLVSHAVRGDTWQYSRLSKLRLLSAGGLFRTGIWFDDVAYWNNVTELESDCTLDLFDLGDANNLILDDINLCRFSDIGIRSFMRFHAPCSSISGRNLSVEGVFHRQTLVRMVHGCTGVDLEFLRVEGRQGSSATNFVDFNGAKNNRVLVLNEVMGIGGAVWLNQGGNLVMLLSSGQRSRPEITGSRADGTALQQLLEALHGAGLIVNASRA
jgi:hypothetical protein